MKKQFFVVIGMLFVISILVISIHIPSEAKEMPGTVTLKLEGAKMAPVKFPHKTHTEKIKIDCAVCHHKDKNPKEPESCTTCHQLTQAKGNQPIARDAFHTRCQTCHKENVEKGVTAPTKCMECHKR